VISFVPVFSSIILIFTPQLITQQTIIQQETRTSQAMSLSDITPSGKIQEVTLPALQYSKVRALERVVTPTNTSDGAGVRLKRSIGGPKIPNLDPFLLLDEFKSDDPKDYEAGFPEHPHRGFETVTIMLHGNFKHQDNKGNSGYLTSGGVQWMTAGKGIQHSETPMQADGLMWGFQLWVNLPSKLKMSEPRYQDINAHEIPTAKLPNGTSVRVIAGQIADVVGPVNGVSIKPILLDVSIPAGQTFEHPITDGHTLFLYTIEGKLQVEQDLAIDPSRIVIFSPEGDALKVSATADAPTRFLVVSGAPINEPIARHGPFVMNTREEILQCFSDLYSGNF
jgi:redox-sensitive bicupin YhaK (pirin superfamily)